MKSCFSYFAFELPRPLQRNAPERYDYVQLEAQTNQGDLDPKLLMSLRTESKPYLVQAGRGISHLLQEAMSGGKDPKKMRGVLMAALLALDEQNASSGGVDALDEQLKSKEVDSFHIDSGLLIFSKAGVDLMVFHLVPERYRNALKEAWGTKESIVQSARENREKMMQLSPRQEALARLSPPEDRFAIPFPKLERKDRYRFPKEAWIASGAVPQGLAEEFREQTACSPYAFELVLREVGEATGLHYKNFARTDRVDAWEWLRKTDFQSFGSFQGKYLSLERGTIVDHETTSPQYAADLMELRDSLAEKAKTDAVVLGLWNRFSDYKGIVAGYNRKIPLDQQSLNTHMVYVLGEDFRAISLDASSQPLEGELLQDYLIRVLHIGEPFKDLLNGRRLKLNGQEMAFNSAKNLALASSDRVEFFDLWVAHHYKGEKVTSFSELVSKGDAKGNPRLVPAKALSYPKPKEEQYLSISDADLKPAKVLNLKRGETVKMAFERQVSSDPRDWVFMERYLKLTRFDASQVRFGLDPIPVPDLALLKKNPNQLTEWELALKKEQIADFEQLHPGEHLLLIELGSTPWNLIKPFFEGKMSPALSKKERDQILAMVDLWNSNVDLREISWKAADGIDYRDRANFRAGEMLRLSDVQIASLLQEIQHHREAEQILVPDTLNYSTEEGPEVVSFSREEANLIEGLTQNPLERALLILILQVEQKGGTDRAWLAAQLEEKGWYQETTVGLFQIRPMPGDLEWLQAQGYSNLNRENLRTRLKEDSRMNGLLALKRLRANIGVVQDLLAANGESGAASVQNLDFVRLLLSTYNRSTGPVLDTAFRNMGENIAVKLGVNKSLDRSHVSFEWNPRAPLSSPLKRRPDLALDVYYKNLLIDVEFLYPGELPGEEQINTDTALLKINKIAFLGSPSYRALTRVLEKKGYRPSILLKGLEYQYTDGLNYGYRAVSQGQLQQILDFSAAHRVVQTEAVANLVQVS